MSLKRCFLCCLCLAAAFVLDAFPLSAQDASTSHTRADAALQSFLLKFWDGNSQYLRNRFPSDGSLTSFSPGTGAWTDLDAPIVATNSTITATHTFGADTFRLYRVQQSN